MCMLQPSSFTKYQMFPVHQEFRRALDEFSPYNKRIPRAIKATPTPRFLASLTSLSCSTANSTECIALTPEHPKRANENVRLLVTTNHAPEHQDQTSPNKSKILHYPICM
ncbi:uncharacterized protein Bfra_000892 [Botrytis fragariae]|uniref:Uncharacterized protein n=1 Tax=Botrytis fragariae TaxID=1964551 RepID=A0A8H6B3X4_9HELO|nr:uncharacterized protein Bfra_000892 [Botrytis fragariae]KAF5878725.1 hypothetical protein Bfra_000892 [Botrytis fragariae]